ncbi:MAG TPA: hypothetical protein VF652_07775 [Allosphingosinicella sp.]
MEEEAGAADVVNAFITLLGAGTTIASMFGSGGISLDDLIDKFVKEVRDVFEQELETDDIQQATSAARTVSDYFKNNYAPDQQSGLCDAELYDELTTDGLITTSIVDAQMWCSTMEQWAIANPDLAKQSASLALLLHGLVVAYYREIRNTVTEADKKAAAALTLQNYARDAVQRVLPLYQSVAKARMSAVSPMSTWDNRGEQYFVQVRDSWMGDPGPPWFTDGGEGPATAGTTLFSLLEVSEPGVGDGDKAALHAQAQAFYDAYVRLLQYGEDSDRDALLAAIAETPPGDAFLANAADLAANTVPKILETGRWLNKTPSTLRALWVMAGGQYGYVVAYPGSDGGLTTNGDAGALDWELGMMTGTSATVVGTPAGFQMAFQSNEGFLWNAGDAGNGALPVALAAGTTPSVVCMPDGSIRSFVALANGTLGEWDVAANRPVRGFGWPLAPGTSPCAAALPGGDVIVAFHSIDGMLCTIGEEGILAATGHPLAAGTSPSVTVLVDGSWVAAFQSPDGSLCSLSQTTASLWVTGGGPELTRWPAAMAPGSSPAIASSLVNDFMIAYQAPDLSIHMTGSAGTTALGQGMAGSNPAIAALPFQGYQVAFQDSTGALATAGDGVSLAGSLPMLAGISSPRIAGLRVA